MFSVVANNSALQLVKILRTLLRDLVILHLKLEIMVAGLHGLLRPEPQSCHLSLGLEEFTHMRLQKMNLIVV